jgi:hypothetical protein
MSEEDKPATTLPDERPVAATWENGRGTPARERIMQAGKVAAAAAVAYGGYKAVEGVRGMLDTVGGYSGAIEAQASADVPNHPPIRLSPSAKPIEKFDPYKEANAKAEPSDKPRER